MKSDASSFSSFANSYICPCSIPKQIILDKLCRLHGELSPVVRPASSLLLGIYFKTGAQPRALNFRTIYFFDFRLVILAVLLNIQVEATNGSEI